MNFIRHFLFFFAMAFWTASLQATPTVTSLTPSNGNTVGGNFIEIKGSDFVNVTAVDFGSTPATSFTVIAPSTISAQVPAQVVGAVHVTVTAQTGTSSTSYLDYYTYTENSWRGIISVEDENSVTLFDTDTYTITATIPLPTASSSSIMTPNGKTIYAIDSTAPNVYVIDAATNAIVATIGLPPEVGSGAFDIIVNPAGTKIYISNNVSGYVTVIDTSTNGIEANILVGPFLGSLSITPDGQTVYVSNFSFTTSNVTIIDAATNTVGISFTTGFQPGALSITPDGTKGFIGNSLSDTVSVIDIATNTVTNTIPFAPGSGPYGTFILPNGQTVYVANLYNNTITVIDVATEIVITTLSAPGTGPFWLAGTPDSKKVFVANLTSQNVTPIDVATNTLESPIAAVPGVVNDIEMSPDPAPVASFTITGNVIDTPILFDASASISPIGTIADYTWDFGDGTIISTPNPTIFHTYTSEDFFDVILTVTNSAGTSTTQVFSSRFMSNNGGPSATLTMRLAIVPSAPSDLTGAQTCYFCLCKIKVVNRISWEPPTDSVLPAYYVIYRNASLLEPIGIVYRNQPLRFEDYNIKKGKTYTYYVVAVSISGTVSAASSVTVLPVKCKP